MKSKNMKAIKQFIFDFKNSFYNPEFYKELRSRTLVSGVLNFVFLGIFSGLVIVVFLLASIFPEGTHSNIRSYIQELYPDELVVTIEDGKASINLSGPYIIPFRDEDVMAESDIANLLVIDTSETATIDDLDRYKTIGLLTSDRIILDSAMGREGRELQIFMLSEFDNLTIDEVFVLNLADRLRVVYNVLLFVVPLFIIVFVTAALVISYLILTLIATLATMIVSKIWDLDYSFKEAYVVSMFAMIPVITYDFITDILRIGNLFSLGALVFIAIIVLNLNKKNAQQA